MGAGQFFLEMVIRTVAEMVQIGDRDQGFLIKRQFDLGFFGDLNDPLHDILAVPQIDRAFPFHFMENPVADLGIEIAAPQKSVSQSGNDFVDVAIDFNDGNVEGAAAQIVNGIQSIFFDPLPVGDQGRRRFIDNAHDIQPGNFSGHFGGLPLGIIKKSGDRDHGVADGFSQIIFSDVFQVGEEHAGNLFGGIQGFRAS